MVKTSCPDRAATAQTQRGRPQQFSWRTCSYNFNQIIITSLFFTALNIALILRKWLPPVNDHCSYKIYTSSRLCSLCFGIHNGWKYITSNIYFLPNCKGNFCLYFTDFICLKYLSRSLSWLEQIVKNVWFFDILQLHVPV